MYFIGNIEKIIKKNNYKISQRNLDSYQVIEKIREKKKKGKENLNLTPHDTRLSNEKINNT